MKKITTTLLICLATYVATAQTAKIYDFAGNHNLGYGYSGDGGPAVGAQMGTPQAITFDATGNMYIADGGNAVIRMVNTAGIISTIAGTAGSSGYSGDGGYATAAQLGNNINALVFDGTGNLYVADAGNSVVRMINTAGIISTFAGGGTMGDYNVQASNATLNGIAGLAYSNNTAAFGANGALFITETGGVYSRVLYVTLNNSLLTILGGAGTPSNTGDGGAVDAAQFNTPRGMAFDASGNLYIADAGNNRIRVVTASLLSPGNWIVSNFAGNAGGASGCSGDGGQATAAKLQQPYAVTVDLNGNVYIADNGYSCIRKVNTAGLISTITTTCIPAFGGYNGDAITATTAKLNGPVGVACDVLGNIYVADYENDEVREITTACIPPTITGQPKDTTVCDGSSAHFSVSWANSTGYQWQVNKGSGFVNNTQSAPNSPGQYMDTVNIAHMSMNGWQYHCIVKGCSNITSSNATLTVTQPTITCNIPVICAGSGASATLTASGATSGTYNWSTGDVTDYIVESPTVTTTYTVMGTDQTGTGCSGTGTGTITVLQPQVPIICEVTTDSTTNYKYNYIYWDAAAYSRVDTFIIYRYDPSSGNYLKIGTRAHDSLSIFIDKDSTIGGPHGGNPAYASWKYKLAIKDSCGNIGRKGPYHQSVFVQQTGANFSWTAYIDSNNTSLPTGYAFLRDDLGTGNFHLLANVGATASTDPNYLSYPNAVYRVDALGFSCTPTTGRLSGNNSVDAAKVKSHSNTNNNRGMTTGLKPLAGNNQITIYPNPNNGNFVVTTLENTKTIIVTDVLGNELMSINPNSTNTNVNLNAQPNGIYFIKVISDNAQTVKRVLINN